MVSDFSYLHIFTVYSTSSQELEVAFEVWSSGPTKYNCSLCEMTFNIYEDFKEHIDSHYSTDLGADDAGEIGRKDLRVQH